MDAENSFVLNNQAGIAKKRAMKNIGMQNLAKYTIRGSNTGQRKLKHANLFILQSKLKTSKQFAFTTVETWLQNLCFRCVRQYSFQTVLPSNMRWRNTQGSKAKQARMEPWWNSSNSMFSILKFRNSIDNFGFRFFQRWLAKRRMATSQTSR